jgi:hypothetical protein
MVYAKFTPSVVRENAAECGNVIGAAKLVLMSSEMARGRFVDTRLLETAGRGGYATACETPTPENDAWLHLPI